MTTPQNPEEEPVGDELPDDLPGEPHDEIPDRVSAEDALWLAIVDNYGDRPKFAEPEPEPEIPPSPRDLALPPPMDDDGSTTATATATDPEHDTGDHHYVPPAPPPLPTPPPARLLAWVGLFGVPMFVLVALVTGPAIPSWLGLVLMGWFVGGFVFLVASMRPGDDHDDGARL